MYKLVQNTPVKGPKNTDQEVNGAPAVISEYAQTKKKDKREAAEKKGWTAVNEGGSFGAGSPGSTLPKKNNDDQAYRDPKETIRRN